MAHRFGELTRLTWLAKRLRLSLVAALLGLLAVSAGLALPANWLVSAQSNDFDADAEDIRLFHSTVYSGQLSGFYAQFQNLSPSTGPHGGEATFDVSIVVEPPTGTATRFSWDNEVFTLDQERTFTKAYTFASAGTYTVRAEIYDINGQQSGWNADNRFDQLTETFTVREPVTVQISPSSYTVDEDVGEVEITVTMSESLPSAAEVTLRSRDDTATSGDYGSLPTTVAFPPNTTSQTKSVTIRNDQTLEATRKTFYVLLDVGRDPRLSVNPLQMETAVTIVDDDEVTVGFDRTVYTLQESSRFFVVCLRLTNPRLAYTHDISFTVHLSYTDLHGVGLSGPSSLLFDRPYNRLCVRYQIPDDNVVEEDSLVEFTLDSVTSDSPGVASRVKFGISTATLNVIDDSDRAFVEFEHRSYSVREGNAVELCAVLKHPATVAFPFTLDLSYTDPDGALSSGPTSLTFGALDANSCVEFQTQDDDVGSRTSVVDFRLIRPTDLDDPRIIISTRPVRLTVIDDDSPSNTPPMVSRVPTTPSSLTLTTGDSRTFTARATDPDDNLEKFEWFVNDRSRFSGALSLTGPATRRYTYTFSTPGTYTVRATFTDEEGESDSVSWTVVVDGQSSETVSVTVASSPSGRTVTVDGTDRTTPYTATWNSGASHNLDVPSPQNTLGNRRYIFSSWSHGGARSQSVAPASDTTYTANFTQQHFLSTRTEPRGIGVNGAGWYGHGATATVGPAPSIDGYEFSHWRRGRGGQNIGSNPAGVSVKVDAAPFLVEAVYTISNTVRPPSVSVVSPLASPSLEPGDNQTFEVRATDPDNDISGLEWSVNGQSQGGQSLALTGDITRQFTHTFSTAGIHSVKVTFTDTRGSSDSVFWTVQVDGPPPPSVSIVSPLGLIFLEPGDSQTFEVKATDPDNNISGWEWSVNGESGGGQSLLPTGSVSRRFSHTFPTVGNHTVEATFTDKKRKSDSVIWSVRADDLTPANRPPSVYIVSPSSLLPTGSYFYRDEDALFVMLTGEMQIFEVLAEDPDDNLSGWEWQVDGRTEDCGGRVHLLRLCAQDVELTSPTAQAFAWSFDTPGNHEVAAIFTDAEGATGTVSWQISVPDPAELIPPEPPQPSVEPDEPDDGKIAYISGVEANRATESDGDHATISLWAITRPSCDYFTAGRPAEENPFMSVKEGLWVRLTVTNPSNFPRKSPIGMKVTYRNHALNIERTREVKRLWPGCQGKRILNSPPEFGLYKDRSNLRLKGTWHDSKLSPC